MAQQIIHLYNIATNQLFNDEEYGIVGSGIVINTQIRQQISQCFDAQNADNRPIRILVIVFALGRFRERLNPTEIGNKYKNSYTNTDPAISTKQQ